MMQKPGEDHHIKDANSASDEDNSDESSDDEEFYEEFFSFFLDDNDEIGFMNCMLLFAIHLDNVVEEEEEEVVRTMNKFMSENARIQAERDMMLKKHLEYKQPIAQEKEENIRYVQQLARECGVDEGNPQLWSAVRKITKVLHQNIFIEYYAGVNN